MRHLGARFSEWFGTVPVKSDLALLVGLVLAAAMIVVVAVFVAVAVARLMT
jgi:hypothetical protein